MYGPKVTTSSGYLGVSATKGEIWTPESAAKGSGSAIWTPGSDAGGAAAGEKSRIILPGPVGDGAEIERTILDGNEGSWLRPLRPTRRWP